MLTYFYVGGTEAETIVAWEGLQDLDQQRLELGLQIWERWMQHIVTVHNGKTLTFCAQDALSTSWYTLGGFSDTL